MALNLAEHKCAEQGKQPLVVNERLIPMGGAGGRAEITYRCLPVPDASAVQSAPKN